MEPLYSFVQPLHHEIFRYQQWQLVALCLAMAETYKAVPLRMILFTLPKSQKIMNINGKREREVVKVKKKNLEKLESSQLLLGPFLLHCPSWLYSSTVDIVDCQLIS